MERKKIFECLWKVLGYLNFGVRCVIEVLITSVFKSDGWMPKTTIGRNIILLRKYKLLYLKKYIFMFMKSIKILKFEVRCVIAVRITSVLKLDGWMPKTTIGNRSRCI